MFTICRQNPLAFQIKLDALEQLQLMPDKQLSLTDPDSRSMATRSKGSGIVGYNVQTAVESEYHLIVAHEVTNVGHDRTQLYNMASQAREASGAETGNDGASSSDGRTSVWDAEILDGCDAFSDHQAQRGRHRDEPACTVVQF